MSWGWLFFFFFLDWNGGLLSGEFPDVCSVCFGSISVTANTWHGLQIGIWMSSRSVFQVRIHRHYVTKLAYCLVCSFIVSWVAALCVAVHALAVVCVQFPAGWRWEGLWLTPSWVFTVSSWVHIAAILITLCATETVQLSQDGC